MKLLGDHTSQRNIFQVEVLNSVEFLDLEELTVSFVFRDVDITGIRCALKFLKNKPRRFCSL